MIYVTFTVCFKMTAVKTLLFRFLLKTVCVRIKNKTVIYIRQKIISKLTVELF